MRVALYQPGEYWPLAFSPDGATLLTTGWHQDITVWDLAERRKRATWSHPPGCDFYDGAFAPDGRTFAAGWVRNAKPAPTFGIDLVDVATAHVRATISTTTEFCSTLMFIDGGTLRVSVSHAGVVEVVDYDVASGRVLAAPALLFRHQRLVGFLEGRPAAGSAVVSAQPQARGSADGGCPRLGRGSRSRGRPIAGTREIR